MKPIRIVAALAALTGIGAVALSPTGEEATATPISIAPPDGWEQIDDPALADAQADGWWDPKTGVTLTTAITPAASEPLGPIVRAAVPDIRREIGAAGSVQVRSIATPHGVGELLQARAAGKPPTSLLQLWIRTGDNDTIVTAAAGTPAEAAHAITAATGVPIDIAE